MDQIRAVSADAVVLPNEAGRKVYIIEDADSMNIPAQNAALKLLEEPPAGVMFLLCVTNAGQLLPTVRSRCTELNLNGAAAGEAGESRALAAEFVKCAASGDRPGSAVGAGRMRVWIPEPRRLLWRAPGSFWRICSAAGRRPLA